MIMTDDKKDIFKENKWEWFKDLVYHTREINRQLIREQDGSNHTLLSIDLYDRQKTSWVALNPHSIDLRSKECFILINDRGMWIDVERLLLYGDLIESR